MAASFSLIIEDDAGKQIVVPFAKDVITIGRKEGNTIRLTERNVSRFHAKLEKNTGGVLVEDLSSFNGVKLNGDRIAGKVQVSAGDVIEIGDYHLELRAAQAARAAAPGPVGSKAGAVQEAPTSDGDEFEGDTQRWDPPPAAQQLSVGTPTQEDTMPHTPAHGGFGEGQGDTERVDLQHLQSLPSGSAPLPSLGVLGEPHAWPPPSERPSAPPAQPMFGPGDLEPTARQPVANVPLGGLAPPPPPLAQAVPPPPPAPPAPVVPPAPMPSLALSDETQDLPSIPSMARLAPQPTTAPPRKRAAEETEQMRPAPAGNPADDVSIPRLVVLNTIFAGSTFPLKAMENVLGRTDDNDIVLEHRSVSRNHAKLVREGERVRILDLKSANGVLVNGEEVEQHVLKSGDIIELGRLKIRFVPVGERFAVPADEIERARIQDAAGDDNFEESAQTVNVTSPLRQRTADSEPPVVAARRPMMLYGVFALLGLAVIALIVAIAMSGDDDAVAPPVEPTPTPVGVLPVETETPMPTPTPTNPTLTPPVELPLEPVIEPVVAKDPDRPKQPVRKPKEVDFEGELKAAQTAVLSGEHKRAVEILKDLEKINPKDPRIHRNLGISYARLRENANASKHYRKYLELNPTAPDADKVREILAGSKGK